MPFFAYPESVSGSSTRANFSCFGYFNEVTGVDVIDVAVNRNMLSDERMLTDTAYVLS